MYRFHYLYSSRVFYCYQDTVTLNTKCAAAANKFHLQSCLINIRVDFAQSTVR